MKTPAIQNDFSYYRRTLTRQRIQSSLSSLASNETTMEDEREVSNELANHMSLFYAHATPMLKTLSEATSKFVTQVILSLPFSFTGFDIFLCVCVCSEYSMPSAEFAHSHREYN